MRLAFQHGGDVAQLLEKFPVSEREKLGTDSFHPVLVTEDQLLVLQNQRCDGTLPWHSE